MLNIHYCKTGDAINDFVLETVFKTEILAGVESGRDASHYFSTENIFNRIRLGIVSGELSCNDVTFVFEDQKIHPNEYGSILNWPKGFCEANINLSEKIIRAATKKYNEKKNSVL